MNSPATARSPGRSRLALIVAGVLALLGSFVVTAPAQAGYYGDSYYGSNPCSYRYRCGEGYYARPYRRYHGCSACGCYRRCNSGLVYERRYVEREYVERRYGGGCCRRHYGYSPYGGYRRDYGYYPYRRHYGYYPYRRRYPWGYGYGGVGRRWSVPFSERYEPSADRYDEPPQPPAPVWNGTGAEPVPYGDQSPYGYRSAQWNVDQQEPVAAYGVEDVSRPLPRGPLGMIESGLLGFLGGFGPP
jgi:hypothetical protein